VQKKLVSDVLNQSALSLYRNDNGKQIRKTSNATKGAMSIYVKNYVKTIRKINDIQ